MVITIVGHVATVSPGVKLNGSASVCTRPGAQWSCRNRHQGEGPPERAHTGPGSTKPRYSVYRSEGEPRSLAANLAARQAQPTVVNVPPCENGLKNHGVPQIACGRSRGLSYWSWRRDLAVPALILGGAAALDDYVMIAPRCDRRSCCAVWRAARIRFDWPGARGLRAPSANGPNSYYATCSHRRNPSTQWTNAPTHTPAHRGRTSKWRVTPHLPEQLDRHGWRIGGRCSDGRRREPQHNGLRLAARAGTGATAPSSNPLHYAACLGAAAHKRAAGVAVVSRGWRWLMRTIHILFAGRCAPVQDATAYGFTACRLDSSQEVAAVCRVPRARRTHRDFVTGVFGH